MRAAALPTTDHMIALGDEVRGTPEFEVGERLAKPGHEFLHFLPAPARRMQ